MKATMRMTMDGLIQALRSRAHQMADRMETGYGDAHTTRDAQRQRRAERRLARTKDDDVSDA